MSGNDAISRYYSALKDARTLVSDIDNGATVIQATGGQSQDVTAKLREHQQLVIDLLDELAPDKERRKTPRRA